MLVIIVQPVEVNKALTVTKRIVHQVKVSDSEQSFCAGTAVKRRTFNAAFLAVSKKHSFSRSARNDLIKFVNIVLPDPNLASSNYMFKKK